MHGSETLMRDVLLLLAGVIIVGVSIVGLFAWGVWRWYQGRTRDKRG